VGGVSVGDEMSPRQNADAHKALEARATSSSTVLIIEPTFQRSFP